MIPLTNKETIRRIICKAMLSFFFLSTLDITENMAGAIMPTKDTITSSKLESTSA